MLPYAYYVGQKLWNTFFSKETVENEERRLNDCLKDLEIERNTNKETLNDSSTNTHTKHLGHSGKVIAIYEEYGVLVGNIQFSKEFVHRFKLKPNDLVCYTITEHSHIAKILYKIESLQGNSYELNKNEPADVEFNVFNKIIIGQVIERNGRNVKVSPKNIKFHLDKVVSNFIPIVGDWIELHVETEEDSKNDAYNLNDEILNIASVRSLRSRVEEGSITVWDRRNRCGLINNEVFFYQHSCSGVQGICVGDKIVYDAIESTQTYEKTTYNWRALSIVLLKTRINFNTAKEHVEINDNQNGIEVSQNLNIGPLNIGDIHRINMIVNNSGTNDQTLLKLVFLCKHSDSQLRMTSTMTDPILMKPKEILTFTFECRAKFMGFAEEKIVLIFDGFKIYRLFKIDVSDPTWAQTMSQHSYANKMYMQREEMFKKLRNQNQQGMCIQGIKIVKSPNFVKVKIPPYVIPSTLWDTYFKHIENEAIGNFIARLGNEIPTLMQSLDESSYKNKFHSLLYLEEIQEAIRYRTYDTDRAYLTKCPPYLRLVVEGLYEKRPSLQTGDFVKVKNPWCSKSPLYEGCIHKITGDSVFLRFCDDFQNRYNGEDLSVEFFFSRSVYRKCHFAIDLAHSKLGPEVLFPDRLVIKEKQLDLIVATEEAENSDKRYCRNVPKIESSLKNNKTSIQAELKKRNLIWFNKSLNKIQKEAVKNVLFGSARPLPYVIFGPPGTGKTVTLVEIIMQLVCLIPHSRLLIATPSNSAANLLTQRLIKVGNFDPGFLIRLVSNTHIESGLLPAEIKSYCATANISIDKTRMPSFHISEDGIRNGCNTSFIGRHRITIGTCVCLSSLIRMGFTTGHFTHVLVDEAGQATEPEIMLPLSFIKSSSGQIILSGDPKQLGPVVISTVATKYGLGESYLERLLNCYPYQKDIEGHGLENGGYDSRLVTKLTHNYRSLQGIIHLSSILFYEDRLVSQIDEETPWVKEDKKKLIGLFDRIDPIGIVFHGIRGVNYRGEDAPSWYNPQEATMVAMTLCKLYKQGFSADDIGIITPYGQQVKRIKAIITDINLPIPKIGSVEEFQGQERKIMLLSTVRSNENLINGDCEHFLGFVKNPKRVNVALTRAQILLIIFGNPHLLCLDITWRTIIQHVITTGKYIGCNLPTSLDV